MRLRQLWKTGLRGLKLHLSLCVGLHAGHPRHHLRVERVGIAVVLVRVHALGVLVVAVVLLGRRHLLAIVGACSLATAVKAWRGGTGAANVAARVGAIVRYGAVGVVGTVLLAVRLGAGVVVGVVWTRSGCLWRGGGGVASRLGVARGAHGARATGRALGLRGSTGAPRSTGDSGSIEAAARLVFTFTHN